MRTSPTRVARTLASGLLVGALTGALLGAVAGRTVAAEDRPQPVIRRDVVFTLTNTNETSVPCLADGATHTVSGTLVGPRDEVLGHAGSTRINILVHDAGTGGWFWDLAATPRFDYAGRLAERGETSLVLDRLGFDDSPLADGRSTCLGAQATMLHQVVQNVEAGIYRVNRVVNPERVAIHAEVGGESLEDPLPQTYVDYQTSPRELTLRAISTLLDVHTRVSDLYSSPHDQIAQQLRLTIETIKERQESELINNAEYGLLSQVTPEQTIETLGGAPTPDDLAAAFLTRVDRGDAHPLGGGAEEGPQRSALGTPLSFAAPLGQPCRHRGWR